MYSEWIEYNIDPNLMWVSIAIKKPEEEEAFEISTDYLLEFLRQKGIKTGISHAALEALSTYVQYNKEVIVAKGKAPVNGADGYHQFLVEIEDSRAKPVVAADGSVDYLNSLKIAMVEQDQVFARYVPPTLGEYGFNVYSEMLSPIPGKNVPGLRGKGFTVSEDGREYRANYSGRIYQENDRIVIDPLYTVNGDLGIQHGNIRFNGDVHVQGDMHSGLTIEADGSIFISGHVGNCVLRSGGNITIGKGVQGKYGCEICAEGDVAGNFVEHCNITAGGNVYANSLLNCIVHARDSVIVTSKNGCIIGGSVTAIQSIQAKELGNVSGLATRLTFGEWGELRKETEQAKARKEKVENDIELFSAKMKQLEQLKPADLTDDIIAAKRQLAQAKVLRQTEGRELAKWISATEEEIFQAKTKAHIRVTGVVYPGVVVTSERAAHVQTQAYKDVYFISRLDKIRLMSPEEYRNLGMEDKDGV